MTQRIQLSGGTPEPYQQPLRLHALARKTAAEAGPGQRLIELVKICGSMLSGYSFCLDPHTRNARKPGETERRICPPGA
ncbi:MAG TPA: carboxymuconolactone decarboxylase family protein [Pseudonocardiaceae bacterium]|nr:carboxymuconolactone decarboxylase family protein [Pseudonocardiaceae bacterium]